MYLITSRRLNLAVKIVPLRSDVERSGCVQIRRRVHARVLRHVLFEGTVRLGRGRTRLRARAWRHPFDPGAPATAAVCPKLFNAEYTSGAFRACLRTLPVTSSCVTNCRNTLTPSHAASVSSGAARCLAMKETLLDVLMYLFENYHDGELEDAENQLTLRVELAAAGFPEEEVDHAFAWLDGLVRQRSTPALAERTDALRVYARQEQDKLSADCQGFLLYLEQLGIINAEGRELIIERLLALPDEIDLERVKWVCLLVLINQPGEEEAVVHLEDMVYYQGEFLH